MSQSLGESDHIALREERRDRGWMAWYAVLTVALAVPLLWAFLTVTNLYPISVWSLFSEPVSLTAKEKTLSRVLVGEFADGSERPLRPIRLTDALTGRIHTMVGYVIDNRSLLIPDPHPENAALLDRIGGTAALPAGVRIPDLLRAWATIHNAPLDSGSPRRLEAIRLDERIWPAVAYRDYRLPSRTWRVELP